MSRTFWFNFELLIATKSVSSRPRTSLGRDDTYFTLLQMDRETRPFAFPYI